MRRLLESEQIGDKKPTQFLRHLQSLAGTSIDNDVLRRIWVSRLPQHIQTSVVSQLTLSLEQAAEVADIVMENTTLRSVHNHISIAETSKPPDPDMYKMLEEMKHAIHELQSREHTRRPRYRHQPRSRSSSRTRRNIGQLRYSRENAGGQCWYHHTYGTHARKCVEPCAFKHQGNESGRH